MTTQIHGRLWRCSTARGSGSVLSLGGPTMVKAQKSFLFTKGLLKVENKEHLVDVLSQSKSDKKLPYLH